jgi:hypothetical protein
MRVRIRAISAALLTLMPMVAHAQTITFGSVSRVIQAQSTTRSNTTTGGWSDSLFVYDTTFAPPGLPPTTPSLSGGGGYAVQDSSVTASGISGSFLGRAWDGTAGFSGRGVSGFSAQFTIDTPFYTDISGSWSAQYVVGVPAPGSTRPTINTSFLLSGPGGTVFQSAFVPMGDQTATFQFQGVLPVGTYTVSALADIRYSDFMGVNGSRTTELQFTMSLPAPGAVGVFGLAAFGSFRRSRRGAM